jgi:hypothetical protein
MRWFILIEQTKRYICECGREFTTPNSFNGHKSNCKTHLIAVGKPVDKINVYNPETQAKAHATLARRCAEKREQQLLQWLSEKHTCEKCGNVMTELYGTGRFCSRSCANSRTHSEETRNKLSKATKAFAEKRASSDPKAIRVAKVKREPTDLLELSKRTISKIVLRMELPCSCCGIYIPGVVWDLHHIKARKAGGSDSADNLTYICPNCHRICHTDVTLLPKPLISLKDFLILLGKRWQDYYFAKTSGTD